MIKAYNFLASWQLFPEKGSYEFGNRPKSGIFKIVATENKKELTIHLNWVSLENQAFASQYNLTADGALHAFTETEFADSVKSNFIDAINFEILFY